MLQRIHLKPPFDVAAQDFRNFRIKRLDLPRFKQVFGKQPVQFFQRHLVRGTRDLHLTRQNRLATFALAQVENQCGGQQQQQKPCNAPAEERAPVERNFHRRFDVPDVPLFAGLEALHSDLDRLRPQQMLGRVWRQGVADADGRNFELAHLESGNNVVNLVDNFSIFLARFVHVVIADLKAAEIGPHEWKFPLHFRIPHNFDRISNQIADVNGGFVHAGRHGYLALRPQGNARAQQESHCHGNREKRGHQLPGSFAILQARKPHFTRSSKIFTSSARNRVEISSS